MKRVAPSGRVNRWRAITPGPYAAHTGLVVSTASTAVGPRPGLLNSTLPGVTGGAAQAAHTNGSATRIARTLPPTRSIMGSGAAEKRPRPRLVIGGAGELPHQLGRGEVLERARRHPLAQRLQRVMHGLHRGRERRMALQGDLDIVRGEKIGVGEIAAAAAEQQWDLDRRRDRLDLGARRGAGQEQRID